MRTVPLRQETADMLRRPIKGRGGFQSLMRRIQNGLRGRQLRVEQADLDSLLRAASGPSVGGFQRRSRDIVVDAVLDQLRAEGFRMREDFVQGRVLEFRQRGLPFGDPR